MIVEQKWSQAMLEMRHRGHHVFLDHASGDRQMRRDLGRRHFAVPAQAKDLRAARRQLRQRGLISALQIGDAARFLLTGFGRKDAFGDIVYFEGVVQWRAAAAAIDHQVERNAK